ncbi:NfeD family protein [uncultured Roseivirga sp.]|uniref:NfeD family protein n=1 Tax=uncultured Roseivirga sp. TaxID=543088 RepID=UPI0030DB6409|tara:strand:+ start:133024 stop:133497 length:474 start_codon:yes stop_codon:yes gene_type:complete
MGEWIAIILLVIIGLILIYIELLFVPGTTVVGVVGFALTCAGVYLTYEKHGTTAGNYMLVGSFLISVVAIYFSFKSKSWDRFSLKDTNKGKFNEGYSLGLEVGMEGIAISDLKPVGKGEFGDKSYEVVSMGSHIESGSRIEIIKVLGNRITVERINN